MTRRRFLQLSATGAGLAAGSGVYTWRLEPHWLEITERQLRIANLPANLLKCRLAQLSDLHIGPRVDDAYLRESFDRVKSLSPDIVVYTGDFTSYALDVFDHARRVFGYLPLGRLATVGILGNHDYGPNWAHPEVAGEIAKAAQDSGVRILRNQVADIQGLQIAGLDDLWAGQFDLTTTLAALEPGRATLVLSHNPDTADLPGWISYSSSILAGHTHGGQCKPPFLPPPLLPVKNRRYTSGEFDLGDGRWMYINRGIGHLMQVRFNVRPEITIFTLSP